MKRLESGEIVITENEKDYIAQFIDTSLDVRCDCYTRTYASSKILEEGRRSIDPEAYAILQTLQRI